MTDIHAVTVNQIATWAAVARDDDWLFLVGAVGAVLIYGSVMFVAGTLWARRPHDTT